MTTLYPVLRPPSDLYCSSVTVYNTHPFPLGIVLNKTRFLYLIYPFQDVWRSVLLDTLRPGQSFTAHFSNVIDYLPSSDITPFVALSTYKLPIKLDCLSQITTPSSQPAWRATLLINKGQSYTSFQGECPIFPLNRSLFSFSPFIQDSGSHNFFYLLNVTESAKHHYSDLKVYDPCHPTIPLATYSISTNSCNLIKLDEALSHYTSLIFYSPSITGVPVFMSNLGSNLSIEHTHPAASFTLGADNRAYFSKMVASNWFRYIQDH